MWHVSLSLPPFQADRFTPNLTLTNTPPPQINVAYGILTNPHKRAQYDRDRLEYLYTHFASHESFPCTSPAAAAAAPSSSSSSPAITFPQKDNSKNTHRDEQIQVYAATLAARVRDPLEDKKKSIAARLARLRDELDEFNEKSTKHRQDWATAPNTILRMAGNALREIVVCAEEDLCMLEDELGRLNGVLAPRDTDGPVGRVTSGQYGSELDLGGGVGVGATVLQEKEKKLYGVLAAANHRPPSIPRSPTVPIKPLSASKLGVQGEDSSGKGGDSSGSEGAAEALAEVSMADDRVNKFLLGSATASGIRLSRANGTATGDRPTALAMAAATIFTRDHSREQQHRHPFRVYVRDFSQTGAANGLKKASSTNSPSPSTLEKAFPPRPIGMGLVEWQALHGTLSDTTHVESSQGNNNHHHDVTELLKGDFQMPNFPLFRPGAAAAAHDEQHPQTSFIRKTRGFGAAPTTGNLTPMFAESGGDTGNFGFHVSQPFERTIPPPVNMMARSAGIKDFQVRVWSAAKAAKTGGGGEPPSGAEQVVDNQEQAKDGEKAGHHNNMHAPEAAVSPGLEPSPCPLHGRVSPGKDHEYAAGTPVFRRTKSGTTPAPTGDDVSKNDGPSAAVLDDPFR